MRAAPQNRALRLRHWTSYYADRWHIDFRALTNHVYGADALPMPCELRQQITLLNEIAAILDHLLPLGEQGFYWHHLCGEGEKSPATRLETERGCLAGLRNDLQTLSDLLAIEQGGYKAGVLALENLLSKFRASDARTGADDLPLENQVRPEVTAPDLWRHWPDSVAVGRLLGGSKRSPAGLATRMRRKGSLLGVCSPAENRIRFPPCQIHDSRVLPVIQNLLPLLPEGSGSGWIKAFWLYSANKMLSGQLPADLLADQPEAVLDAARAFSEPRSYLGW